MRFRRAAKAPDTCLPSPEQTLLLRAGLLPGRAGLEAFEQWRRTTNPERLDRGSARLLPLVRENLRTAGSDLPLAGTLDRAFAKAQSENESLFEAVADVLHRLSRHGIEAIVLKGAALAIAWYPAPGARPMDDCDLLVRPEDAMEAGALLRDAGWRQDGAIDAGVIAAAHAVRFTNRAGQHLDLHWHVMLECCDARADDSFREAAEPLTVNGAPALMLSPSDLLFHVLVHGMRWSTTPPVRWAADAVLLVRTAGGRLDWERLAARAEQYALTLPVRDTLQYLVDALDLVVPKAVVARLSRARVPRGVRREYEVKMRPRTPGRLLLCHWFQHRRTAAAGNWIGALIHFPVYLYRLQRLRGRGGAHSASVSSQ